MKTEIRNPPILSSIIWNRVNKHKKTTIQEKLLCLSIICSPLRCYGVLLGGFNFSFFRIFGLLMILTTLLKSGLRVYSKGNQGTILAIFILSLLQGIYSPSLSGAISNYISITFGFLWMYCAYNILKNSINIRRRIPDIMFYSTILPLVLGLYQWFIYTATGAIPGLPFKAIVVSEGKTGLTYNVFARITSCFGDPAYFATFLVIIIIFSLQYCISARTLKCSSINTLMWLLILSICIIELLMSISISGIVGVIAGLIVLMVLNSRNSKYVRRMVIFSAAVIIGIATYYNYSNSSLLDALLYKITTSDQTTNNLYGRQEYIYNALNMFLSYPLTGTGFGGLRIGGSFSSAHSSLLTVLGQQGLIVFILHIYLLFYSTIKGYLTSRIKVNKEYMKCFLSALIAVLVLTLAYDTLYSLDICYVIIILALASRYGIEDRGEPYE